MSVTVGAVFRRVGMNGTSLRYRLRFSDRSTLAISVYPDLSVEAVAPRGRTTAEIDARVERRIGWVRRQQRYFESLHPLPVPRRFSSGETHRYLGRQYRLRVVQGPSEVRLRRPRLVVSLAGPATRERVKQQVENWLRARARQVFATRMERLLFRAGSAIPAPLQVRVRRMEARWGSCTAKGTITLNPELVRMPISCIDYVIAHELCHLIRMNHSKDFHRLLGRLAPDWQRARGQLNRVR